MTIIPLDLAGPRSLVLAAILLFIGSAAPVVAGPDDSLIGQQLVRDAGSGDSLRDQLFGLLGENGLPGVREVNVTHADPRELVVSIHPENAGGYELVARLIGGDGQPDSRLAAAFASAPDSGEVVELGFALRDDMPEGTEFQTTHLLVQYERFGRPVPGLEWRYALSKRWAVPISPRNVVVAVKPMPIGEAANLPASWRPAERLPVPRRRLVPTEAIEPRYQLRLPATALQPAPASAVEPDRASVSGRAQVQARAREGRTERARTGASGVAAEQAPQLHAVTRADLSVLQLSEAARLSSTQQTIMLNTDVLRARLPEVAEEGEVAGLRPEDIDRGAHGPSANTIDLLSIIRADTDIPVSELFGIRRELFLDRNPESGVIYYVPRDYNLSWSPDDGFGLRMLYAAVAEGMPGQVLMALRLNSGVRARDNQLIQRLVESYRDLQDPQLKVETVRPLPVTNRHPSVNIADSLGTYFDIAPDDLVATVYSDVLAEMDVAWSTDELTRENIELVLLRGVGFGGDVTFELDSEPPAQISVPARVRLADRGTFGRMDWQRNGNWRNHTPYPLRLRRLHALVYENKTPIIYSWQLNDIDVPPQARVEWDATAVPDWLDSRAESLWVEYAVNGDCEDCSRQVMREISFGAARAAARQDVLIATLTPLADLGAAELGVRLRSRYFDSHGDSMSTTSPVIVNADRSEFTAGPVYLVDRQPGEERPGDPLFEYQVEVVMPDGSIHQPPPGQWISSQRNRVLIGTVQIEQSLGYLPGRD